MSRWPIGPLLISSMCVFVTPVMVGSLVIVAVGVVGGGGAWACLEFVLALAVVEVVFLVVLFVVSRVGVIGVVLGTVLGLFLINCSTVLCRVCLGGLCVTIVSWWLCRLLSDWGLVLISRMIRLCSIELCSSVCVRFVVRRLSVSVLMTIMLMCYEGFTVVVLCRPLISLGLLVRLSAVTLKFDSTCLKCLMNLPLVDMTTVCSFLMLCGSLFGLWMCGSGIWN